MSSTATYAVVGMTCSHCVEAVRAEVAAVTGVTGVDVDLATGTVVVSSDAAIDPATVVAAVVEAGYQVGS